MAGKPINIENTKPSYDEVINELLSMISKLVMENSIMKVTIKKFEDAVQLVKEEPQQEKN
jgi:hypothetical protein